jgi:hypothetical protein
VQDSPNDARNFPRHALLTATSALVCAALLSGCSVPVRSDGHWAEGVPRDAKYSRVLVVGVSPNVNQRCAFEEALASNLRDASVVARSSCREMGTEPPLTRENVEKAVVSFEADAVLATRLVDSSMQLAEGGTRETRGDAYYKPLGFGWGWDYWGWYGVPVVYGEFQTSPSVFSLQGTVKISSALFETRNAQAVYFVETTAKDLSSREQAMTDITPVIAERFVKSGPLR